MSARSSDNESGREMDTDESEEYEPALNYVNTTFREILLDIKKLQSDADCMGDALKRHDCWDLEKEVVILKDQVAFLAKRILVLHYSHEETKDRLNALTECHGSQWQPAMATPENITTCTNKTQPTLILSVETQTDLTGSDDSQDSGCLTSSSGSPSSTYHSRQDLPTDDALPPATSASPLGDAAEFSDTATLTPGENHLLLSSSTLSLLRSLIAADVELTRNLKFMCRRTNPSVLTKTVWRQQVEDLFFRHTLFLQLLTSLKEQCCRGMRIRVDQVMVHLLRFWSDQETMESYMFLLSTNELPVRAELDRQTLSEADKFSNQTISPTPARFLWNHVFFLSSYLKGIADSCPSPDVHLDHLLSIFVRILTHSDNSLEKPCLASSHPADYSKTLQQRHDISPEPLSESHCHVAYIEGTSTITGIYRTTETEILGANGSDTETSPREDETTTWPQEAATVEDEVDSGHRWVKLLPQRKVSWRKHLMNAIKHAAYRSPTELKKMSSEI